MKRGMHNLQGKSQRLHKGEMNFDLNIDIVTKSKSTGLKFLNFRNMTILCLPRNSITIVKFTTQQPDSNYNEHTFSYSPSVVNSKLHKQDLPFCT